MRVLVLLIYVFTVSSGTRGHEVVEDRNLGFLADSTSSLGGKDEWNDWDLRQSCRPDRLVDVTSVSDIYDVLSNQQQQNTNETETKISQIKVAGSGHSFSPIVLTDDDDDEEHNSTTRNTVLIRMSGMNRVLQMPSVGGHFSTSRPFVSVEAGIRLKDLNEALLEKGYALENLGAIAMQTISGAIATSTHGTGSSLGSLSSQVKEMEMILANGSSIVVNRDVHGDVFDAARVGLGALGIVTRVDLYVVPAFKLRRTAMPYPLDRLLRDLPALQKQYERLQWYFTPYTNNATLLLREPVPANTTIVPCWPQSLREHVRSNAASLASNVTCVDWSFKALCHEADDATLYTEMEYFVDRANESQLVHAFLEYQENVKHRSTCGVGNGEAQKKNCSLFSGVRYVARDDTMLSPMSGRDIAVFSFICLGTESVSGPSEEFELFARGLERIGTSYGGRPHWGKMNWATYRDLSEVYPRMADFKRVRKDLDPKGLFLNAYLRRTLGEEEPSPTS